MHIVTADAGALNNHANTLWEKGQLDKALSIFNQIVSSAPHYALGHLNRGLLLIELERDDAAIESLNRAIACQSSLYQAHISKFRHLAKIGWYYAAIAAHRAFIDAVPQCAGISDAIIRETEINLAVYLLAVGEYKLGYPLYYSFFSASIAGHSPPLGEDAVWRGETLSGKRILLWSFAGFGDFVQFCRYIPLVAAQGGQVVVQAPPALVLLLSHSFPSTQIVSADNAGGCGDFDAHCSMMNLPLTCGTDSIEKIPAQIPYLFSEREKRGAWRQRLNQDLGGRSKLRVGLVWASNILYKGILPDRDIPLAKFASLKRLSLDFISLQKGEEAERELADLQAQGWGGPPIISYSQHVHDFSDTAALIDNLDLVITVDTSVAHLAGAMGKPVWMLLGFDACWRWLYGQNPNRTDSPWYPTARLFRRKLRGDWQEVVDEVVMALQAKMDEAKFE